MPRWPAIIILCLAQAVGQASATAADKAWLPEAFVGGHVKYQLVAWAYPENSSFRETLGERSATQALDLRLNFAANTGPWDFKLDYQMTSVHAENLGLETGLPGSTQPATVIIDDRRRWWDLTHKQTHGDELAVVNRLDRLSVGYTTGRSAWRLGRQAISWGNGMFYTPMDVFNPFDPAAIDKEYKSGDDMLYGQWLFANGDDLQGVAVVRRDPLSGGVDRDQSSVALKYHGFLGMNEFDLLAAEHFDARIIGLGGILSAGGAVWRGDLTWTRDRGDDYLTGVASISYAWDWAGRNVSGLLEYYYNGLGQSDGRYASSALAENPALLARLERSELFTLARRYLAASATIELTPLLHATPNLFMNLDDPSALAQLTLRYDWRQDLQILAALNLPIGPDGSEFGGIGTPADDRFLSVGGSLFAQLAWYF
ncbi:MAG: hypothetical protein RQ826_01455 [Xanthomonadales bacterium]|nr:hypothetical protein [Xanthomonadales bacterium]